MLNPVPSTHAVLCGARVCLVFCAAWLVGSVEINALGQALLGKLVGGITNAETAQSALPAGVQAAAGMKSIEERLAEARAELRAAELVGDGAGTNVPAGISLQLVAARRGLLDRLVRLLEQQAANSAEVLLAGKRRDELAREAKAWTRFPDPPPYSILLTDRLREEIQAEQLKASSGESAVGTFGQLIAENRDALTQAEEKIRQLNERLEGGPDPATSARVRWTRDLERLRSQVAAASVSVLDSESRLRQEGLAESRIRLDLLKRQLAVADANPQFTQADLDKVISRTETARQQLQRELAEAEARSTNASAALQASRDYWRRLQNQVDISSASKALAAEGLSTREVQFETANAAVRILRLILEIESVERTMWEMRFAAYDSRSFEKLSESERRLAAFTRHAELWMEFQRDQLQVSSNQIELQEARIAALVPGSEALPFARECLSALRERDQLLLRLGRRIEQVQRLSQRWAEGLQVSERQLPLLGRVRNLFTDAGSFLGKLWTFELFTAEDTIEVEGQKITGKRSVTLGKVVMAILILVVGVWIIGLFSRFFEPTILKRLKIEFNQARLIRRWLQAFLVLCLVMFSLLSVKIPLTVFAFAGGALAIGLGFGMQTILKNFVSGLILLFERPFRVGDVLEVGSARGMVTEIGLRSSVLQLWDGTETLIPNSSLLENNVSNWTYSSRKVRFSVAVGAAYGSDIRRIMQLLGEVADRHGVVEKDPKPQVFFTDFGDNALMFELRFWVDVIKANSAQVASDCAR